MARPRLEWREAARADLLAIVDYISDDNIDAAEVFLADIEAKAVRLVDNPKLYQVGRVEGTREMLVRKNYILVYAEHADVVTVLRVLHAAPMWPR